MKRYSKLKTDAETIKEETSSGANTAERVGGHLVDVVESMGQTRLNSYSESEPTLAIKPMVCFKYDNNFISWIGASKVYGDLYYGTPNDKHIPLTFFVAPEYIKRTKIMDITNAVFTPATFGVAPGNELLTEGTIELTAEGEDWSDAQFAPHNIISFFGTDVNDTTFRVKSVSEDKKTLTIYARAYDSPQVIMDNCVTQTITGGSVEVWRGNYEGLTYANLKQFVDDGNTIGAYTRTVRPNTKYRGFPTPTPAELWEETYGAKRDLEAGLFAVGCIHSVEMYVPSTGVNSEESRLAVRLAGYKCSTGKGFTQSEYVYNPPVFNPWNVEETNSLTLSAAAKTGTVSCTAGDDDLIGVGTAFTTEFAVGDPIAVYYTGTGSHWQLRIITNIANDELLTVDQNWATSIAARPVYDPVSDIIVAQADWSIQPLAGHINHIIKNGGWLVIGGHGTSSSDMAQLMKDSHGVALQYIKYINSMDDAAKDRFRTKHSMQKVDSDDAPIAAVELELASMSDCFDAYAPLLEAGTNFSVFESGVRIGRARGVNFILETGKTYLGVNSAFSNYGSNNTVIGSNAGYGQIGDRCVIIGDTAGSGNTKHQLVAIGYKAGLDNKGSDVVAIGTYAGQYNSGHRVVALGYSAAKNNDVKNVVAIGYYAGYKVAGHTPEAGTFIVEHRDVDGDGKNQKPLIKGWFANGAIALGCPATALADEKLIANRFTFYLDEENHKLKVKVCYANGNTYKLGEVALSDPA